MRKAWICMQQEPLKLSLKTEIICSVKGHQKFYNMQPNGEQM